MYTKAPMYTVMEDKISIHIVMQSKALTLKGNNYLFA